MQSKKAVVLTNEVPLVDAVPDAAGDSFAASDSNSEGTFLELLLSQVMEHAACSKGVHSDLASNLTSSSRMKFYVEEHILTRPWPLCSGRRE